MKPHIFFSTVLATLFCVAAGSGCLAQSSSSYFLSGSYDRYRLNPALTPQRAFVAFPALGSTGIESNMNVGLSNFLYESESKPGSLTTFMSGDIAPEDFLSDLPEVVRLNANLDVDIFGLGFGGPKWYFWLDSRLRSLQNVSIPDDMFAFMKAGMAKGEYDINDLSIVSTNYLQTAVGFQFEPARNLKVGVSTNVLVGAAYAKVNIDNLHASIGPDKWMVNSSATVMMDVQKTRLVLDEDGKIDGIESDIEIEDYKHPQGYGVTFDLGAEYDLNDIVPGLKVSASVTDLGAMTWKDVQILETRKGNGVEFNGFTQGDETVNMADEFEEMARFTEQQNTTVRNTFDPTVRLAAQYGIPGAEWLSFGELVTVRKGMNELKEARSSVNMRLGRVLEMSGNMAFSNLGTSFGGAVNLHALMFHLFADVEAGSLRLNPQYIPLDGFSVVANVGLRIGIGSRRF
ncbi:MAG: DUF5723 family protein [Bacteroidaceae bacterium]|nr:DUF5723 family protein [Bacteroidaceae bacterium]